MLAVLILGIFLAGGALIFLRVLPTLLALPGMALAIAVTSVPPWGQLADQGLRGSLPAIAAAGGEIAGTVINDGALMLHVAYVTLMAGAMVAVFLEKSGVTARVIGVTAELSGDNPLGVSIVMMLLVALLFTTLGGLGAIVMIGTVVLPVLQAIGVPPLTAASSFLFGISIGGILNPLNWSVYKEVLGLELSTVQDFALPLAFFAALAGILFLFVESVREPGGSLRESLRGLAAFPALALTWARVLPRMLTSPAGGDLPSAVYLTAVLPVLLVVVLGMGPLAAFLVSLLYGYLALGRRRSARLLTQSVVEGLVAVAPATALLMGLGMLLKALWHPSVRAALEPGMSAVAPQGPLGYFCLFALAAPLALYRGPLNIWGLGFGLTGILHATGAIPPSAIMAALLSVGQIQGICDPTNTHNVWTASFAGVTTRQILVKTLFWAWGLGLVGLAMACVKYY